MPLPPTNSTDSGDLLHELSTILESSPAGIVYIRANRLVRCNRRFERMLGCEAGALIGCSLDQLESVHPLVQPVMLEALRQTHAEGMYETEVQVSHDASGMSTWYALSCKRVPNARGHGAEAEVNPELEVIAVLSDITRLRHQKAQLEAMGRDLASQADRTRAILDSVFVGIVTMEDDRISWMNRSARRMFGGDLSDFVGQSLSVVATSDIDHPFRLNDYLDGLREGQSHTFECQVVGRDGRVFWVVGNAVLTRSVNRARQVTYALMDIDRRRQAEAKSAEAQDTLRRIIEMAPMAITVHEFPSLRVMQANRVACGFLQTDMDHMLGRPLEAVLPEHRARQIRAEMESCLIAGEPLNREHRVNPGGDHEHLWDVNYLPLGRDRFGTDQLLLVATDITEQRAAEQARLDAAITQREMLVREVHHRIKNNLQGVAGLLQQSAARRPDLAADLNEVVGQVQAIAQVYGLQVGVGGPLALHSVVQAIAHSVQKTFMHPIELTLGGALAQSWRLPEVESIPIALSLNELLTNAHKHGLRETPLQCHLEGSEAGVLIQIRNRGRLPDGFNVAQIRAGVYGLGLVRALLPRKSARFEILQEGEDILTRLELNPPCIHTLVGPCFGVEPTGQQIGLWPQSQ